MGIVAAPTLLIPRPFLTKVQSKMRMILSLTVMMMMMMMINRIDGKHFLVETLDSEGIDLSGNAGEDYCDGKTDINCDTDRCKINCEYACNRRTDHYCLG